jgi:rare lipoprotein A (peptidoglycan hydrolase)
MRSFFAAVLAAFALAGGASLPAEAVTGAKSREAVSHEGTGTPHLQLARAVVGQEGGAKPADRARMEGRLDRPRYGKPRHIRSVKGTWGRAPKHARQGRAARRSAQRTPRSAARIGRRTAVQEVATRGGGSGVASFYGGRFHGRPTASGVRFDSNAMTAAHRSLPFGTRVRVTHLGNGRSVEVRINDRGPYVGGRIIDLSRGAAGVLGMHGQGVARVNVTVLGR